jgi:uncharacterized membrane protein YukC
MRLHEKRNSKTEAKTVDVPKFIKVGLIILAVLTVIFGAYLTFFFNLIGTIHFI